MDLDQEQYEANEKIVVPFNVDARRCCVFTCVVLDQLYLPSYATLQAQTKAKEKTKFSESGIA